MSRGDWSILAAFAGLAALFVAFGLGSYVTALNDPEPERYQSYRYAADKPREVDPAAAGQPESKSFEYRAPCDQPKGNTESDLCAQWKAANAAKDSAFWTKWGVWMGIIGSSLLLWQIILTRRAVEETGEATEAMREANKIASSTAERQLRPYMTLDSYKREPFADAKIDPGKIAGWIVTATWKNTGQIPARRVAMNGGLKEFPGDIPHDFDFPDEQPFDGGFSDLGPNQTVHSNIDIPISFASDSWENRTNLYYWAWVEYDDGFDDSPRRRSEVCVRIELQGTPSDPNAKFVWHIARRFSGIDEGCEQRAKT